MRSRLVPILVVLGSIAIGFLVTARGMATWDSLPHLERSQWLLHKLALPSSRSSNGLTEMLKWYGPLWALFLGVMSEVVLRFFRDPLWVQQAFNFALYPVGLYALYHLLLRAGIAHSTARLAVALLLGAIRLGGHALFNVNDFPMAMLSLLVPLYLWNKLRELDPAARADGRVARPTLILLGVVAMVPFLVRPPVLVEPALFTALLVAYAVFALRGARLSRRIELVALPLLAGVAFAVAIWPSLWERGRALPLRTAIFGFTRFAWSGPVRALGRTWTSTALPRWYPVIWFSIALTPVAAIATAAGLVRTFRRPQLGVHAGGAVERPAEPIDRRDVAPGRRQRWRAHDTPSSRQPRGRCDHASSSSSLRPCRASTSASTAPPTQSCGSSRRSSASAARPATPSPSRRLR